MERGQKKKERKKKKIWDTLDTLCKRAGLVPAAFLTAVGSTATDLSADAFGYEDLIHVSRSFLSPCYIIILIAFAILLRRILGF